VFQEKCCPWQTVSCSSVMALRPSSLAGHRWAKLLPIWAISCIFLTRGASENRWSRNQRTSQRFHGLRAAECLQLRNCIHREINGLHRTRPFYQSLRLNHLREVGSIEVRQKRQHWNDKRQYTTTIKVLEVAHCSLPPAFLHLTAHPLCFENNDCLDLRKPLAMLHI
jgi:hypothetical protein